jgi:hypothetical protein
MKTNAVAPGRKFPGVLFAAETLIDLSRSIRTAYAFPAGARKLGHVVQLQPGCCTVKRR